ncbi:hypothetical protein, partial [Bacillus cereus]
TEGRKVQFIEEVQSDWGEKGKREGFKGADAQKNADKIKELEAKKESIKSEVIQNEAKTQWRLKTGETQWVYGTKEEAEAAKSSMNAVQQRAIERENIQKQIDWIKSSEDLGHPTAPFVTSTPAWTKLGLKIALKEAIKSGA